jgi:hypothetical protein
VQSNNATEPYSKFNSPRARSQCNFVLLLIHFTPDSLTYSVPLLLNRTRLEGQVAGGGAEDRAGPAAAGGRRGEGAGRVRSHSRFAPPCIHFIYRRYGLMIFAPYRIHHMYHIHHTVYTVYTVYTIPYIPYTPYRIHRIYRAKIPTIPYTLYRPYRSTERCGTTTAEARSVRPNPRRRRSARRRGARRRSASSSSRCWRRRVDLYTYLNIWLARNS